MSLRQVSDIFAATFNDRPTPCPATIRKIYNNYRTTGCVDGQHKKNMRRRTVATEDKKNEILQLIENDNTLSTKRIAEIVNISKGTVHKILRNEHYKSFKFQNHQELLGDDAERRNIFCETMMDKINSGEILLNRILFTDEATFFIHGEVNSQNCRYWSRQNLHLYNATRTQQPQKVNVWAGLIGHQIVGPFFINGNLTGEMYLDLLQQRIIPAINNLNIGDVWFQQDGAPPHYTQNVRHYLHQVFPQRWIGRGGEVEWPARSPDLAPNDFFLWGHLKNNVYNGDRLNIVELKNRICAAAQNITPQQITNAINCFYDRLGYCLQVNGANFEHLLS